MGGIIETYHFDLIKRTIAFAGSLHLTEGNQPFTVSFEDVAAFYFVQDSGLGRFHQLELEEWDYIEFSLAHYEPAGMGTNYLTTIHKSSFPSTPNFALEMWSTILFIEAGQVLINGTRYAVGFPPQTEA
jgi:hypothetical protein